MNRSRLAQRGAEHGNSRAQSNLGTMFEMGIGVEQSYKRAVKWYAQAAKQGDEYGQYNLGRMYEAGWGVPRDYDKAIGLYRDAATRGLPQAQEVLKNRGIAAHDENATG